MKLLESISCKKGITLNVQLVELLSILDEPISKEEQDKKIVAYIKNLRILDSEYKSACEKGNKEKYIFAIEQIFKDFQDISEEDKEKIKNIYLESLSDLSTCNKEEMMRRLKENGINPEIHEKIASKNTFFAAKEGILDLTPEKVRALYSHMFEKGNTYDRVTFDNVGKYSGYVSFDGETYTTQNLDKMIEFCQRHGMESKINALMFYADFPKIYNESLSIRIKNGETTEEERRKILKQRLIDYVSDIGEKYGDRIECVDVFNELIYDPVMKEPGFDEEPTYHERRQGWQQYLSLEDLCEVALVARKKMPNVVFTYNDMNWSNQEKRKEIIRIINEIRKIEQKFKDEGKLNPNESLIDTIGIEAHLTTDVNLDEIDSVFEDISSQIGLPMEITEFDVARTSDDPMSKSAIKKQGQIFERFSKIIQERTDVTSFTIWSQSDELSFMNDKCGKMVYASILDENFKEKEFEPSKEIKSQNFNYHTHTALCGHAYGTMREYIESAIKGGITQLGFSDHTPKAIGKTDPRHEMSMEDFFGKYVPTLEALREEYKDKIDIKIGLESEYYGDEGEQYPQIKEFRKITESKLDYMILGQHFALARNDDGSLVKPPKNSLKTSSHYPLDYAQTVVEAIKSGKFAYIAHPDIFLENRDKVPEDEKEEYVKNALKASEMICEAAAEYGVPLEINLGSISAIESGIKTKLGDGSYPYPVPEFWKIADEKGCKVLIGIDAHTPESLLDKASQKIALELLESNGIQLNFLESFEPQKRESKAQIISSDIGKAFSSRSVSGKDSAQKIITSEQKERKNQIETTQTTKNED